jgi:hypothetical protein
MGAKYGFGSTGGFQADNNQRVAVNGKNALIFEIVSISPSSDISYILNNNATKYGASTDQYSTTGTAILTDIMYATWIGVCPHMVTGVPTTTTVIRPAIVKYINGATTLAAVYTYGAAAAGGSGIRLLVAGKAFK